MVELTKLSCFAHSGRGGVRTVDLTGGAPELNPQFRYAIASKLKGALLDKLQASRCLYDALHAFVGAGRLHATMLTRPALKCW